MNADTRQRSDHAEPIMTQTFDPAAVDLEALRASVRAEYAAVASDPERGFHFHTGYRLAAILGYPEEWIAALPPGAVVSMAGTGNPFALGTIDPANASSTVARVPAPTPSSPRASWVRPGV
jgi:hypothetical protein